jgi:hypothetical protein
MEIIIRRGLSLVLLYLCQVAVAAEMNPETILIDSLRNGSSPFSAAGWEDAIRSRLTELAVGARHRPLAEIVKLSEAIVNSDPNAPSLESDIATFKAESARIDQATESAIQFGALCKQLERLRDPRVLGLVAPFLDEETESFDQGDYTVRAPENRVAEVLSTLTVQKVISAPAIGEFDLEAWRSWWNANKKSARTHDSSVLASTSPAAPNSSSDAKNAPAPGKEPQPEPHRFVSFTLPLVGIVIVLALCLTMFRRPNSS